MSGRVLVVSGDWDFRDECSGRLVHLGCQITTASNVEAALYALEGTPPAAVVSDASSAPEIAPIAADLGVHLVVITNPAALNKALPELELALGSAGGRRSA